jgi:hypothetical protein
MPFVEDDVYLRAVSRYIHLNPVKIAACRRLDRRERLARLESYPWSSYRGYVDAKQAEEFVSYDVLKEYGADLAAARRQYRAYAHACLMEDDAPILEVMAAIRYAIGDAGFVERMEKRVEATRSGRVQDEDLLLPRWTVPLEEIDVAVARRYRIDVGELQAHGHHAGEAKVVAVELACRLTGLTLRAIGGHYGEISSSAVCAIHRKVQKGVHDVDSIVEPLQARLQTAVRRKRP